MSIAFASKISTLRRERNITQKAAAEDLGISQALLSHYEKGIRECNLDFVVKAAVYYDVSADYLLGLSETKHTGSDLLDETALPSDTQINSKTVLRAFMYLQNTAETDSDAAESFFNDYFALTIKKYITLLKTNKSSLTDLCDLPILNMQNNIIGIEDISKNQQPDFIKTIDAYSMELIQKAIASATK